MKIYAATFEYPHLNNTAVYKKYIHINIFLISPPGKRYGFSFEVPL